MFIHIDRPLTLFMFKMPAASKQIVAFDVETHRLHGTLTSEANMILNYGNTECI